MGLGNYNQEIITAPLSIVRNNRKDHPPAIRNLRCAGKGNVRRNNWFCYSPSNGEHFQNSLHSKGMCLSKMELYRAWVSDYSIYLLSVDITDFTLFLAVGQCK